MSVVVIAEDQLIESLRGKDGAPGEQGPQGPAGQDGKDGVDGVGMGVSILRFGADRFGSKDSTKAFEAAIDSGERKIYVPYGKYKAERIRIPRAIDLYGDGRDGTEIQIFGTGGIHGLQVVPDGSKSSVRLREFQLRYIGNGQTKAGSTPGSGNWSGIYLQRSVYADEVYVRGFTNDGIYFAPNDADEATGNGGTIDAAVFFAKLQHVWSKDNGRDGLVIRRGANANLIENCDTSRNGRYGLLHMTDGFGTYGTNIVGGQASYNGREGFRFENGTNIQARGFYAEFNGTPTNTNTDGYTNTPYDIWIGDNCVRSEFRIGVLLNSNVGKVRLPAFNPATIQVWEGGKKLFGN